ECGRQIRFDLLCVATQECVESVESVDGVVAAINLIHNEPHRVVFGPELEGVIAFRNRQIVTIRIEILEEQCAVSWKSHCRDVVSVVELSHSFAACHENEVRSVEILPVRLIIRERLAGLAPIKPEGKLIQDGWTQNARMTHGNDVLVGLFS